MVNQREKWSAAVAVVTDHHQREMMLIITVDHLQTNFLYFVVVNYRQKDQLIAEVVHRMTETSVDLKINQIPQRQTEMSIAIQNLLGLRQISLETATEVIHQIDLFTIVKVVIVNHQIDLFHLLYFITNYFSLVS